MIKIILPKIKINIERWKYNKELGIYVSNMGNFKDSKKKDIKILTDSKGYLRIPTKKGVKTAHRIVMTTWKPVKNQEELTIDHLDHNKRNNSLSNLEWVTADENLKRAIKDFSKEFIKGEDRSKLKTQKKTYLTMEDAVNDYYNKFKGAIEKGIIEQLINIAASKNITLFKTKWRRI